MYNFCSEPEGAWTIEDRLGYWYHSRYTDDVHDGYWITEDGEKSGQWNYTAGSTTDGVWEDDYGDVNGTWTADVIEESIRHVVIEEHEDDYGYSMGEPCMMHDDCEGDLICKDVMTEDGMTTELRCGYADEDPTSGGYGMGEACMYEEDCEGDLICKDVMTEDGMTTELRRGYADEEEPEEMYAGEDEPCGFFNTTTGEEGYIMCMEGLVCQAVEDPTATDTYGYTMICVNDTTNYGENAAGEWHSNSTNATGFNGTGYWFSDFTWVSENGMMRGTWDYDSGSQESGTWTFD